MIPKKIHYCWFGGNPLPELAKKCIESWRKYCPDYEIKEWNESNFDLNSCRYVREAFENRKWAFITDYVRLYAMVTEGGIYMDTDVEVIAPLDNFLDAQAFSGFENLESVTTGIMACEKDFPLFKELLAYYDDRPFVLADGSFDIQTNVVTITNICKEHGLVPNNTRQTVDGFEIYPKDYFCPKSYDTGKIELTKNTATIHHFSGSWMPKSMKISIRIRGITDKKGIVLKTLGRVLAFPFNICFRIKQNGLKGCIDYYLKKGKN